MKSLKILSVVSLVFGVILFSSCSDLISEKNDVEYGSISINSEKRAVFAGDIKAANVKIYGFDSNGEKFEKSASSVSVEEGTGKGTFSRIEKIPVSKNAVIEVQAYEDSAATSKIDGVTLYAVCDVKAGENSSVTVDWESSKKGKVLAALLAKSENLSKLTDEQLSSIYNAIPSGTHASLIDANAIAADFKAGTLNSSSYTLKTGSVKITANGCSGCTIQVSDPNSKVSSAVSGDSAEVTISDVAPGTWNVYAVKDGAVVKSGTVTVTSGAAAEVVLGETVITDKIIVHVPKSLGYGYIWAWATSGSVNYTGGTWPGKSMTLNGDWYNYTIEQTASKVIFNNNGGSVVGTNQTSDLYIPSAGEYWYIGGASGTLDEDGSKLSSNFSTTNPNQPVPPTVTVPSKAYLGGSFTITVSSDSALTQNTISINGISKTLAIGSNSFNVSEFTTSVGTIQVSGTISNSAGSKNVSGSISVVEKPANKIVSDWNELRIYQIMVSSFQDGDSSVGYGTGYGPGPHNGDLQGIINALDYIKSLGMNAIWLTPIFTSDGNNQLDSTGYFCSDYFNVDPKFGGNAVFEQLVTEAHVKGLNVILDGVFGHHRDTGVNKPSPNGKYPSGGNDPVKYPDSLDYYKEVAQYWIENYKIDGWRFDQCYQVGLGKDGNGTQANTGGHNYWYEIRTAIKESAAKNGTKGQDWGTLGYTVGEHWDSEQNIQAGSVNPGTASGYGLQSCFDFPSRYKLVQMFATEESFNNPKESTTDGISLSNFDYVYSNYTTKGYTHPEGYYPNLFITNHDLVRFGNLINWKFSENRSSENYWKRHKIALASVAAYSGPITIYYGDEYGMMTDGYYNGGDCGSYNDNIARDAGKISGFSTNEQDLHDYVATLMHIREENEIMWKGSSSKVTASDDFYVGKKTLDGKTVNFAINNSTSAKSFSAIGTDLVTGESVSGTVTVPALSARFVLVK